MKEVVDLLSDDEQLKGCGGLEQANAQRGIQHLVDLAGDKSLNEQFNDVATDEIPNSAQPRLASR